MLNEAAGVEFRETDSVLEALILEANLIKKHQPDANVRDKDNKSFNYLVITNEAYPRVLVVRGRDLFSDWKEQNIKYLFGPFPKGGALKEGLKIIRKILPFRDACNPEDRKPCFNRQIKLCPGVCSGEISKTQYAQLIRNIKLLFEGRKERLLLQLEREMKKLAKIERFEEAAKVKQQVLALTHIKETALLGSDYKVSKGGDTSSRIEGFDIAHTGEASRVGVMVAIEDGVANKALYRKFNIRTEKKGDVAALEELLKRRLDHPEWPLPNLLVLDGGVAQKNAAIRILNEFGYKIPIVNVVKNDRHKASKVSGNVALIEKLEKEILLANAEAHRFALSHHRKKRSEALK
tara:strand:- start:7406 stop:8452 length:1047 start_codon:yes stop_codon:yes gene_type:complete